MTTDNDGRSKAKSLEFKFDKHTHVLYPHMD